MISEEKVSIIIPVYNVEKYLDKCIESVCNQTYQNVEIIIVDDGSTDKSAQICDFWEEKNERVKVIHQKNSGVSAARNAGLSCATGKYILFVDSDDIVDKKLLEETIPYMENGTEMVAFGYRIVYDSEKIEEVHFPCKEYDFIDDNSKIDFIIGPFFRYEVGWNVWNRIFLKEYIDKYEIKFEDVKKVSAEDQLFCLCYLSHCYQIKVLDKCLYDYIQRNDSYMNVSSTTKNYHITQKNELSKILYEYYSRWNKCKILIDIYPVIHYFLLERPIQKKESDSSDDVHAISQKIRNDIKEKSDIYFFDEHMWRFSKYVKVLKSEYSIFSIIRKKCRAKELVTCNSYMYKFMMKISKVYKR